VLAQLAGADQITVHLREDRRHINDRDVRILRQFLQIPLNLEMANSPEIVNIALEVKPDMVTLVPEKREERTTEGGLAVKCQFESLKSTVTLLQEAGIPVSLFIEPSLVDVELSAKTGAQMVELHTGKYSECRGIEQERELARLEEACRVSAKLGLIVHAGHGLHYHNAQHIARLPHICDLNIGHSIIARAVLVGLDRAVREMKQIVSSIG
jgi:pyridoxine 5-phosphate synthase